jgi:serine phosphatase RsbU (regulator of sigma subunit)
MATRQACVLVVDDNEDNRDMLARRIRRMGHTVVEADNGRAALERLQERSFDLVLLDIMMPEMNGFQVLEQVHHDVRWRHIPVVVISALDDMDSVVRCVELGAEDYLFKPFNAVLLSARIGACLDKKWLRDQEQAYLAAMRQEMELGRQIQADFMPVELPAAPGWEIAARFRPAYEVAGDFYDVFPLPDNRLGLLLGDVSGKGVSAALFMALTRSLLRAFSEHASVLNGRHLASPDDGDILDAVRRTNRYILRHHQQRTSMFATLFMGVLEVTTGRLSYINAGHVPPLIARANAAPETLDPTGPLVGVTEDIPFQVCQTQLGAFDCLLVYTDGVTEAMNARHELLGAERLAALLAHPVASADDLLDRTEAMVHAHSGAETQADDLTMLSVRRIHGERVSESRD